MSHSRRDFLKAASAAAAAVAIQGTGSAFAARPDTYPRAGDPLITGLAARALEAARAAGAAYADVRFTLTRRERMRFFGSVGYTILQNDELGGVGVRALVDGAWGFAASALWTPDEMARLGREAAVQARTNARGRSRKIDIGAPPPVATGEWRTPIRRDPFDVTIEEKLAVAWGYGETASRLNVGLRNVGVGAAVATDFERQERTFASTDGSLVTQTTYVARPEFNIGVTTPKGRAGRTSDILLPAPGGWEVVADAKLADEMPRLVEESILMIDAEKVQPDRYDVVLDARATAQLVARTIGVAAELDRVLGYEANAGGTSYLAPPEERLGKFALGSPLLNVTADRANPRGAATVKWDDEGVVPDEYTLVRDGVLVDYHTTRELVPTLASWYQQNGRPLRSHGCAASDAATGVTMLQPPNINMRPGTKDTTFDDLVASMDKGLVVCAGSVTVDRQQLNGEVNGEMVYEVRGGKRTRFVHSTEVLFRAPELWKGLKAVGGASTHIWTGESASKGQPRQDWTFGVGAVPAMFSKLAVTDKKRKA